MNTLKRYSPLALAFTLILMTAMSCSGLLSNEEEEDIPVYSHTLNPGSSAPDFLTDDNFKKLEVEIDYMMGYEPNAEALDSLEAFLEQRLNKVSVSILTPTQIPAAGQSSYTATDVRNLEATHRNEFSSVEDSTLSAYMIILDSKFSENNVLGIAYYNTSNAFFGGAYDEVSGGIGQPSRRLTESISFRHEFGHLFGLVNIPGSGTEMQTNHQDTDHGHHCTDDQCLMYYAMENAGVFGQFFGEEIPSLDANCLNDLRANGGK